MLNRFQFARLRGFRRGNKRSENRRSTLDDSRGARTDTTERVSRNDVRDAWEDDDRVARLLARRAAEQDQARQDVLDRQLPDRGQPTAPSTPTTPVDVAPPVTRTATETAEPPSRTTTIPSLAPGHTSNGSSTTAPQNGGAVHETGAQARHGRPQTSTTARVVCIASGKGGTGKSVLASNLALLRAQQGERVLLVDFDAGLANAHLLLGLQPPYDVGHVMEGEVSAQQALVDGPHGMKLLSGGVGRQTMIDPTRRELDRLFKALRPLESEFDLILIDHGAGLSYSTVAHLAATSTLILVTNHEVTALSDAYALYKRAHMVNHGIRVGMVVNRVPNEEIALDAWERFRGAAHKFLGHSPEWIGWVPVDARVPQAVQMRTPAVLSFPDCDASRAFRRVGNWPPLDHARSATAFYERARRALR